MQASIIFPSSAAWNEAIRPAIENHSTADQFQTVLDSIASQLTNPAISPDTLTYPESSSSSSKSAANAKKSSKKDQNENSQQQQEEKQQLINIGARIIFESILAGFVPGSSSNGEEAIISMLTTKSTNPNTGASVGGDPLQSQEHAAAVAAVWVRYGKKIANAQRTRALEEICQRSLSSSSNNQKQEEKDDDANILRYVSAEVRICRHSAGASNNDEEIANKEDLFEPFANFAIAGENCDQQQQQRLGSQNISSRNGNNNDSSSGGGVVLQLSADQTYNFLCEIDAIQRKLDELRS